VLAVKDNQPWLAEDLREFFTEAPMLAFVAIAHSTHRSVESGHGRLEVRQVWATDDPEALWSVDPQHRWPDLCSLAMGEAERRVGGAARRRSGYTPAALLHLQPARRCAAAGRRHPPALGRGERAALGA
jgi:hypothetical protein